MHHPHSGPIPITQFSYKTARALVFNPDDPQHSKRVCIVLDSGSQRSYITEQLKSELNLIAQGEQSMSIMTFGSSEENARVCDVVGQDYCHCMLCQ